ncbi:hypothetical protein [Nocardiopsis synnemataformans]|uniref:hypothetical protein n=1 Tax=Nocardiopsis synnemataformans TaxID=61305 RepID=UPI003EBDA285
MRRGGFASREAARAALRRARSSEAARTDPAVRTVAEWLRYWLDTRTRLRPRTRVGYVEHIDRYLNPYLGEVLLEELTPALVQEAFDRISRHTLAGGVLLSSTTVQRVRATLRAALTPRCANVCSLPIPPRGCGWSPGPARGRWCGPTRPWPSGLTVGRGLRWRCGRRNRPAPSWASSPRTGCTRCSTWWR